MIGTMVLYYSRNSLRYVKVDPASNIWRSISNSFLAGGDINFCAWCTVGIRSSDGFHLLEDAVVRVCRILVRGDHNPVEVLAIAAVCTACVAISYKKCLRYAATGDSSATDNATGDRLQKWQPLLSPAP
jgi:hypothetical protein